MLDLCPHHAIVHKTKCHDLDFCLLLSSKCSEFVIWGNWLGSDVLAVGGFLPGYFAICWFICLVVEFHTCSVVFMDLS